MKILELRNLFREEGYIYYMRKFTGTAIVEIPGNTLQAPVSFSIETSPLGERTIDVDVNGNEINYPILPIKKALTQFILDEDLEGRLP